MPHPPAARQRGVTLTEIMIAMFIIAISFMPIMGALGTSVKATVKEDTVVRAMNLCQEKLNTSLHFPFEFFVPNLGTPIDVPIATPGVSLTLGPETIEGVTYTSVLTVSDRPGIFRVPVRNLAVGNPADPKTWTFTNRNVAYNNLVHTYTLEVSWIDKGGTARRFYTLVTFRADLRS
ncbi:MAG TPA: prepilin-type N-terminal cleavage/methylation domain-containing protein [Candidatus Ozemobacteraceae bacterium]|nr:prepilin-type N-terminal cleavage/methylation domain-containing protein [Candidatus Ozemobacteraceae bacterium]